MAKANWGSAPANIQNVIGCKECGEGVMPTNLTALIAANNVNTNFSYEDGKPSASKETGKGGRGF